MKKVFEIFQIWFLASCCASFFTIFGSVIFVMGLVNAIGPPRVGNAEIEIGFCIASTAAFFACSYLLLVLLVRNPDDEPGMTWAMITGLPSLFVSFFLAMTIGFIGLILGLALTIFGFTGGWIFGETYEYFLNRKLDRKNFGFFENLPHSHPGQN